MFFTLFEGEVEFVRAILSRFNFFEQLSLIFFFLFKISYASFFPYE